MQDLITRRLRLAGEQGFAMALVMGVMFSATIFGVAAWAAANGDIGPSADNRDRKQAYSAAEAGIAWYQAHLSADPNYWTLCANTGTATDPVNEEWNGVGADPRRWSNVPGSSSRFTIELIPAPGRSACSQSTMIDSSGSFRIRATGFYSGEKRSIVARFARRRFLDYIYFTDFETSDPATYNTADRRAKAAQYCGNDGTATDGSDKTYRAKRDATKAAGTFTCTEIRFGANDVLKGPVHSNDQFLICGSVTFGDSDPAYVGTDSIESSQSSLFQKVSGCTDDPDIQGSVTVPATRLDLPTTNGSLAKQAQANGLYLKGTNIIRLLGTTLTVQPITGTEGNLVAGAVQSYDWPTNGLIYVDSDGPCSPTIPSDQAYTEAGTCANAYVSGTYANNVTIASKKDVILQGSFTDVPNSDAMAGLIADNFVRVYHPVTARNPALTGCSGANSSTPLFGPSPTDVTVKAAILSLTHSFSVDNHNCGASLGTLTVTGAIAQKFRGPVGTTGGTGYTKAYGYDRRMKYRNPPLFLDPVGARWRVLRQNEQIPAR